MQEKIEERHEKSYLCYLKDSFHLPKKKPTALIWTKSDELVENPISDRMKKQITDKLLFNIPHAKQYKVTIENPDSVTNVIHDLLLENESFRQPIIVSDPIVSNSPFMCYRGSHV